ncbi:hypothetical protein [Nonomuraea angiospora]|uniref:hypothetical protein n=1 Tax=Nonomuraea angiospora TaxID=46172 RepID=UPI0029A7C244|nr:hypothetical protein [Nonomuraea angiospora]MDX3110145.1 hypothetical protein [Nonomuraea angiospora]
MSLLLVALAVVCAALGALAAALISRSLGKDWAYALAWAGCCFFAIAMMFGTYYGASDALRVPPDPPQVVSQP